MRLLLVTLLLIALAFFTLQRIANPQLKHNSVVDQLQHPFDQRLRYRIGRVDSGFNISHSQLKEITEQAANIWFLGSSKQLFIYDPNAKLSINLIYDQRQADSEARRAEISRLNNNKELNQAEYQKLMQSESQLNLQQQQVEQAKTKYQAQLDQYNTAVSAFNQSSQQNHDLRSDLQQQKQQLLFASQRLEQQIQAFNENVSQLNQQVDTINQLQHHFNHSVQQFNQRFKARLFDKGQFNGEEINIYEFQNLNDLKLTLAHELGHALGILHSQDPRSLMYPVLEQQNFENFTLTAADIALLNSRNN